MKITSLAFPDGGRIGKKYLMKAIGGDNLSVPLVWEGAPEGTKSFAVSLIDPHPIANNWVHWVVIDIPNTVTELKEGAAGKHMPPGSRELVNSFGSPGYGGPQPPAGSGDHPYVFTVYALNVTHLDIQDKPSASDLQTALAGHVLGEASLSGKYGR